jgi:two-component sensor histidine kinase
MITSELRHSFGSAVLSALAHASTKDELIHELALEWVRVTGADSCDILFRDQGDGLIMKASTFIPEFNNRLKLGKGIGLCGHVLQTGEPLFISDNAVEDSRYAKYPGVETATCDGVSILPLTYEGETQPFGVVHLRKTCPWATTDGDREQFAGMACDTVKAIKAFSNAYQAGTQQNRLGALSEVSKTIATSPYLEEILQLLVNLTAQQFNYRVCTVRLLDEDRGMLVLRATQAPAKAYQRKRAIALGESIAGRAIAENRAVMVRDVQIEEDYIGHDLAVEQGLRSMICVPLTVQDKPVGVLSCYTSEVRDFSQDEIKALETLAKQAAISIEHAKLQVRNTLMQEMHHRVKNNLQQVASLLRLQMRHGTYKSLEEALNDCLARILAIASVHDLLSRDDLDHVGVKSLADSLVHHQQSSLMLPDRSIQFQVRGEDVTLNISQATQVALVVNELILNAIEHGFKHTVAGEVHVTVEATEEEVSLWVSNNGDPLPEDFDPTKASNLGLKIVDMLARGLNGRFKLSNILGWTVAEVKFTRQTGE